MNVTIFGATGATGRHLVDEALKRGHTVTAYTRNPAKLQPRPGLTVVHGELSDTVKIDQAVRGADVVLSALGVGRPLRHDPAVVDGIGRIVEAMERYRSRRLVYLSFVGVAESRTQGGPFLRHVGSRLLRKEIADHERKEATVRSSHLDWTIVRPPKLTNRRASGRYRSGEGLVANQFPPTLSRADVAAFMLDQAATSDARRTAVTVLPVSNRA
jgi:putative NADH-flavin reductase